MQRQRDIRRCCSATANSRLRTLPEKYFENCRKVREIARDLKLDIVPAVFPVGYANDILYNDPNLAEGLPVKYTLFVVHDGVASASRIHQ